MIRRKLICFCMTMSGLALAASASEVAKTPPVAAPAAPAVVPISSDAAKQPSELEDQAAFEAMGYMVAHQMRMNIGFNEQQIAWICAGFKSGAIDAETSATYRDDLRRAEMIYRSHIAKINEAKRTEAADNEKLAQAYVDALPNRDKLSRTESGLYYEILTPGDAEKKPTNEDSVKIRYTGSLIDGKVFDKAEEPVELQVRGVVPGFSEGLKLIGEGGKIRLYIPGKLGYGIQPPPGSPMKPGSMLIFDVELTAVVKGLAYPGRPERAERPARTKHAGPDGMMMPPPPPPTTPPPPLPPEILAQLKNAPKNAPTPPPQAEKAEAAEEKAPEAAPAK